MRGTIRLLAWIALLGCPVSGTAQPSTEFAPTETLARLRAAQAESSYATYTLQQLSDVFGSRLLGTPSYHQAAMWAADALRRWGAAPVQLQSFHSTQRGWETTGHSVEMIAPSYARIAAHPIAYTAPTNGTVEGEVVVLERSEILPAQRGTLRGKVVLLASTYRPAEPPTGPLWTRYTDAQLLSAERNPDPNDRLLGYHARRPIQTVLESYAERKATVAAFRRACDAEGVVAVVEASPAPLGLLVVDNNGFTPAFPLAGDYTPSATFVIANDAFGRLLRLTAQGYRPRLRLRLDVAFHNVPAYDVNVLADMEGTDLKDELVIIGAHLDGHPAATAASDNSAGVAAAMEAIRLLRAAGLRPRRTIRLALWGGEEQGFQGSLGYVTDHVGDLKTGALGAEHALISAVLNLDNGAGRIRGIYTMGNSDAAAVFRDLFRVFRTDSGPGDGAVTLQNANQTDHELFDALNVPAFQLIQDPLGYIPLVHHTNLDVVEYVPEADLRHNAVALAYLAFGLAQRDAPLPRKLYVSIRPSLVGRTEFAVHAFAGAKAVSIVADFNNWGMFSTPLARVGDAWVVRLDLPPGRYLYKYIVDGSWTADPATPSGELTTDGQGHAGLTVRLVPPSGAR